MGKPIVGESSPLTGLSADSGMVIIEGILFKKDSRPIKNEKKLVTLLITDKKTSVCLKAFCSNGKWEEIDSLLKNGDYIKVRGETEWDRYDNCLVVMMKDIERETEGQRRYLWSREESRASRPYQDERYGRSQRGIQSGKDRGILGTAGCGDYRPRRGAEFS